MTDDTGPGPDRLDMLVEVELSPPTEGDDIGIGEPFRVKYRTGEGVKTTRLRIVRMEDDSMEPEIREGDWVVVDLSDRLPEVGGKFLIRLGESLVARQIEAMREDGAEEDEPLELRLISTNPDFAPCSCLARDVRILGKVLWVVRRV